MKLFEKQNPHATRKSVIAWACGMAVLGGLGGFVGWYASDMPYWAVFLVVPMMMIGGAIAGAALEWQMDE